MAKSAAALKSVPASVKKTVNFTLKKETPGAVCYQELVPGNPNPSMDDMVIGSLYIRKKALGGKVPQAVMVEVSYSA